jgi:hypothetical protein
LSSPRHIEYRLRRQRGGVPLELDVHGSKALLEAGTERNIM